jgi:hypothetical protein
VGSRPTAALAASVIVMVFWGELLGMLRAQAVKM